MCVNIVVLLLKVKKKRLPAPKVTQLVVFTHGTEELRFSVTCSVSPLVRRGDFWPRFFLVVTVAVGS